LGDTPAVFVNRLVRGHPSVVMRTAAALTEAVDHLAGLGHIELAYLGGPTGSWAASERRRAVTRAGQASGIRVHELAPGPPTFESGAEAVGAVVASGASAVIAFNAQLALGVMAGLANQGIEVPGEVSVVAGDDVPMAALTAPPLTAISLPTEAAGATAVRVLSEGDRHVELRAHFVPRGSTGPTRRQRSRSTSP
jgi:DNA-binding LacI/PurR family transcriptional regulator